MVLKDNFDNRIRIRLQPNRSASWGQTKLLVTFLGGLCLMVALFWSLAGAWLILPFAGLEVGLFGWLAYRVCKDTYSQQMLLIDQRQIQVIWGYTRPTKQWQFDRQDCLFVIHLPHHSLSTQELTINGRGLCLPLGERLNQQDMQTLLKLLRKLDLPCRTLGQTEVQALERTPD